MASMQAQTPAPAAPREREEGFTLIEVVWALFLLGLIAMGSLGLFLHGMKSTAHLQRQQAAVSLASSAMDMVRSVSAGQVDVSGTSGLIKGRSEAAVEAVWDEATALNASDTADMTMAFDPASGLTDADQWIPVRTTSTVDNQTFTIDTLIGSCYRLRAASTLSQNCTAANPSPSTDEYLEIYRARVVVRWDEGTAAAGAHTYTLSSLVDPSEDATWNTAVKPFAYDDEFSVSAGGSATFHGIVLNDTVEYNASGTDSPIFGLTQPSLGSVSINTALGVNGVVFTPPADTTQSGTVTFTYRVQGSSGEISDEPATVTVHILPTPVDDAFTVEPGSVTDINALLEANDLGLNNISGDRTTTVFPVWSRTVDMFSTEEVSDETLQAREDDAQNLANIGVTTSGGTVQFEASDAEGVTETFYYYLVDDLVAAGGVRYPSAEAAQITITTQAVVLNVSDETYSVDATTTAQFYSDIPWRTLTDNESGTSIRIESITGPSSNDNQIRLDGDVGLGTGEDLDFQTVANTAGVYELTYRIVSPAGNVSDTAGTLSIHVLPDANPPASTPSVRRGQAIDIDLVSRGVPSTGVRVTQLSNPSCGAVQILGNGQVRFTASGISSWTVPRNCTFTFRLETTAGTPVLVSSPATTVTVRVTS